MWMQWGDQRDYIMRTWNVGWLIGTLFVIINLLGQLIPCGMILTRKKTDIACGILVFIIAFQVRFSFNTIEGLMTFICVRCLKNSLHFSFSNELNKGFYVYLFSKYLS
jgi:hypothetical protein